MKRILRTQVPLFASIVFFIACALSITAKGAGAETTAMDVPHCFRCENGECIIRPYSGNASSCTNEIAYDGEGNPVMYCIWGGSCE